MTEAVVAYEHHCSRCALPFNGKAYQENDGSESDPQCYWSHHPEQVEAVVERAVSAEADAKRLAEVVDDLDAELHSFKRERHDDAFDGVECSMKVCTTAREVLRLHREI